MSKRYYIIRGEDREGFKNYMEAIKNTEHDKEEFCKAARISREPMPYDKLELILQTILRIVGMAAIILFVMAFFRGCAMIS